MSSQGKASELHPREVAREIGLDVPSGPLLWWESYGPNLLDAAVRSYWANRPEQSRADLKRHRREQERRSTPPEVWIRRAGAA